MSREQVKAWLLAGITAEMRRQGKLLGTTDLEGSSGVTRQTINRALIPNPLKETAMGAAPRIGKVERKTEFAGMGCLLQGLGLLLLLWFPIGTVAG